MAKVKVQGRLAFCNVWEKVPGMDENSELKYRTKVLISKSDKKQVDLIRAAIAEATRAGVEKHGKAFASAENFDPLQDGDKKDWEGFEGMYHISASTTKAIHIVDQMRAPIKEKDDAVYSGVLANVMLDFYPYKTAKGLKGVSADLGNIQKVRDMDRWDRGSVSDPEDDFEELEVDDGSDMF